MSQRPRTIPKWQTLFDSIYGKHNVKYYRNTEDLMSRLYEVSTKCLESLRKEEDEEIIERLPHIFAWLVAFCNRRKISILDVVWHKYPNVCPYGLERQRCMCITKPVKYRPTETRLHPYRRNRKKAPRSISQMKKMFARIYGPVNSILPLSGTVCHLIEEVAEVGRENRLDYQKGVEAEVADVFAWLCGTATKLGVDLEELLWKTYPGSCDTCHDKICTCAGPKKQK